MTIILNTPIRVAGVERTPAEGTITLGESLEADLVARGVARWSTAPAVADASLIPHAAAHADIGMLRRTPVRVAVFGDSTANLGTLTSPNSQDVASVTAAFPGSGATSIGFASFEKTWLPSKYPMAHIVANLGVSGETTTQMLARDGAAGSTTRKAIQDGLDLSPDVFLFRGASINDLTSVTSSTWQSTADATFARHAELVARMVSGGVVVLDWGVLGFSGSATDPASTRMALKYLNGLIREYAKQFSGKVFYCDPILAGIQAADGNFVSGLSNDGTHLNMTGGYLQGTHEADILSSIFGPSSDVRYPGLNVVPNALFHTQTSGVASGITINPTNITLGTRQIETINGKRFQTVEANISAAANTLLIYVTAPVSGVALNDTYGFEFDFFFKGLNGHVPTPTTIYGRVDLAKTAAGRVIDQVSGVDYGRMPADGFTGKIVFPPFKIQETGANLTLNGFLINVSTSDASGSFRVGIANPRMVKL